MQEIQDRSTTLLRTAYGLLQNVLRGRLVLEPFESVEAAFSHRRYWQPLQIDTLLLAESHIFTPLEELILMRGCGELQMPDLPEQFVRLVYCLGYGEDEYVAANDIVIYRNSGTVQFWKLLYACLNRVESNEDFSHLLEKGAPYIERIKNKVTLLQRLRDRGIWLADASVVGLGGVQGRVKPALFEELLRCSWKYFHSPLLAELERQPKKVIVIGKSVARVLKPQLDTYSEFTGVEISTIGQPQERKSVKRIFSEFELLYRWCSGWFQPICLIPHVSSRGAEI